MLNFLPGASWFAIAGVIAAAGPIIIHLLNRRRYRVINWAAMDFLREALQRNRRMIQLRDILLLALRTAAVLLFGLALARPYFAQTSSVVDPDSPLHAVLMVDNSLSMAYQSLDGTRLDQAKTRAEEYVESLPGGSRVTVIPLCGTPGGYSLDAHRTKDDAIGAVRRIEVVDRSAKAAHAADLAYQAIQQTAEIPDSAKRVVLLSDQQSINWEGGSLEAEFKKLPEVQVVDLSSGTAENTWVSDFRVQDGVADVETNTRFVAKIQHEGPAASNVPVTLVVDGKENQTKHVDLVPGQTREVLFENFRFDEPPSPGQATFVPASVRLQTDHLETDNERYLAVPLVASIPVVFIDQYGADEDPARFQYGETRQLRGLLAPVTTRGEKSRQLIEVRQAKISEVTPKLLEDARLVVIAGIADPGEAVPTLRDYVQQGGQLVIAAGAGFDPSQWNDVAWLDGAGILPAPLTPEAIGQSAEESGAELQYFRLSFDSMAHEWFHPAEVSDDDLQAHYAGPVFFKAVRPRVDQEVSQALVESERQRIEKQRQDRAEAMERERQWMGMERAGTLDEAERQKWMADREAREESDPHWLIWSEAKLDEQSAVAPAELAEQSRPRVLAKFDNGVPFLVERNIGRGGVLMVTSGVFSGSGGSTWNTLPQMKAMFIFDRILRSMIERTLPVRNLESVEQLTVPVQATERQGRFVLERPDGSEETLSVEALGPETYGVTVRDVSQRGIYTVTAYPAESGDEAQARLWSTPIAVNGPGDESQLTPVTEADLEERLTETPYNWVEPGEAISLEGAHVWGQNLWWWLIAAVLLFLLCEMVLLAWPVLKQRREAA